MYHYSFPVIDPDKTGQNIKRLVKEKGLKVSQLQSYFGFAEPQAIYKWQRGESLPSVDNLLALGRLLDVPIEQILVYNNIPLHIVSEQQEESCCSVFFMGCFGYGTDPKKKLQPFFRSASLSFFG